MISERGFNPHWFIGIVEQVEAAGDGRLKVRCFGYHPTDTSLDTVTTDDLPWAYVVNGNFNRMFNWPERGTLVFGFFMDGRDAQHPFVIGSISGGLYTSLPRDVTGVTQDFDTTPVTNTTYDPCAAYADLRNSGLSHNHAIGALVNIHRESGFNPGVLEVGGGGGVGLFQYTFPSRKEAFIAAVPDWQTNPTGQVRYAINSDPEGVKFANRSFTSATEAANYFTRYFENPREDIQEQYINGGGNAALVSSYEAQIAQCSSGSGQQ
jgi:hypothetical protein